MSAEALARSCATRLVLPNPATYPYTCASRNAFDLSFLVGSTCQLRERFVFKQQATSLRSAVPSHFTICDVHQGGTLWSCAPSMTMRPDSTMPHSREHAAHILPLATLSNYLVPCLLVAPGADPAHTSLTRSGGVSRSDVKASCRSPLARWCGHS